MNLAKGIPQSAGGTTPSGSKFHEYAARFVVLTRTFGLNALRFNLVFMVLMLSACVQTELPSEKALAQIQSSQKSVVLMRIVVEDKERQQIPPFSSDLTFDNLRLGLGQLRGGGMPSSTLGSLRFLSEESRRNGWIYIVLSPGRYYLYLYSQHELPRRITSQGQWHELTKQMPRWSFEVPANAHTVYAGSLFVNGNRRKSFLGGSDVIQKIDASGARISNEEVPAKELFTKFLPQLDSPQIRLMERHTSNIFRF